MQSIATFVLSGRNQAILSVIGFVTLALVFPLLGFGFGLLSAASIGLVTLVHGARQGLLITVVAAVFLLGISSVTGRMAIGIEYLAFYWLPSWLLASLLARFNSLSLAIMVASGVGFVISMVIASLYGQYEAEWNKLIIDNLLPTFEKAKADLSKEELEALLVEIGNWVVHFAAAYWVLSMSASLFIARWWQSLVYHPGGFGEEYRQLRLGMMSTIFALVIVALAFVFKDGVLGIALASSALVVVLVFLFQGLSIAHYVAKVRKLRLAWLVLVYIAIFVLMPYEIYLIAVIGLSDNWVNYRSRIKPV